MSVVLKDAAGNENSPFTTSPGASSCPGVDATRPTITIGDPSPSSVATEESADYIVTYGGYSSISLGTDDIVISGDATCTDVTTSGANRTVTITAGTTAGTVSFTIKAGTATDAAGNTAAASGPSPELEVTAASPSPRVSSPGASGAKPGTLASPHAPAWSVVPAVLPQIAERRPTTAPVAVPTTGAAAAETAPREAATTRAAARGGAGAKPEAATRSAAHERPDETERPDATTDGTPTEPTPTNDEVVRADAAPATPGVGSPAHAAPASGPTAPSDGGRPLPAPAPRQACVLPSSDDDRKKRFGRENGTD